MSVFSGDIITPTQPNGHAEDHQLPDLGNLNLKAITAPTALPGVNGVHVEVIHGDTDRQRNGNESTKITSNRSHTVAGNQTKAISGNKSENVVGNFLQTTIGNLHRSIMGATNELHVAEHTIVNNATQRLQEVASHYHEVKEKLEKHHSHIDDYIEYQLHSALVQNFIGHNLDVKGGQNALIGWLAEHHIIDNDSKEIHNDIKAMQNKVTALDDRIGAIQPVVHIAMFHEVSVTQKILVVGVNQFM